ncbi:MAG: hypothetical protein M1608_10190 [Candidatus Omnitrophica bacterium]|nr:hypothetical protein [Candidatus Omnitrophota bacterium]
MVQRGTGKITVHRLWLTEFRFGAPDTGSFSCSDEGLDRIYDAARWTSRLNTLDAFMDCPHRERNAMYSVEAFWIEKAVYNMFGDLSVSRRMIRCGADSIDAPDRVGPPGMMQIAYPMHVKYFATIIPSGPFFWVLHLGLNELYSGDIELVKSMLPAMRRTLDAFDSFRDDDGLLENMPFWIFLDYSDVRTDGVSVAMNGLYAKALDEAARLEQLAGDSARADLFASRANQARASLNRYCAGDSFYPDVLTRNAAKKLAPSKEACETTQYYVMWCDVPPPDRMRRMWLELRDDFIPTPLKKVQPIRGLTRGGLYTFMERMEVSARLGDYPALARDIKAMFLPMVDSAPGTLWEDPMAGIALCHSIGCGVGGVLSEQILGIHPDFHEIRIAPHRCGTLSWCKGYVTARCRRIGVDWKWSPDRYTLTVALPAGTEAKVELPDEAKAVWQSGPAKQAWQDMLTVAGRTTISVKPGEMEEAHNSE